MSAKKLPIAQILPGMVVAEDVYTFNNKLIIAKGTTLTDRVITHLNFYAVPNISIEADVETKVDAVEQDLIPDFIQRPHSEQVKMTPEFNSFSESFINMIEPFKGQLNNILTDNTKIVNTDGLLTEVDTILDKSRNGLHVFDMMHSMRDADDATYIHSINVSLICNVIGKWLKYDRKDLETLTLCGLLHDIGKLEIPEEILKKTDPLTDDDISILREHPLKGYNILKKKSLNIHIQMSAMLHHERFDGSGYPMGMKGSQIDKMAKVVMIADIYDAMTSARIYRKPLCPFEVLSVFESDGMAKFDPKILMTFMDKIKETYMGSTIKLNDNSIGKIVMMNRNNMTRPIIQLEDKFVDLIYEQNLYITEVL